MADGDWWIGTGGPLGQTKPILSLPITYNPILLDIFAFGKIVGRPPTSSPSTTQHGAHEGQQPQSPPY